MAFEQNPYAVKVTLVADSTLQPATTSPLPSTEKQFRFVKIGGAFTVASITTTTGSSTLTGFTATNTGFLGIVPGSAISGSGIPAGAYIVSVNIGAGSVTISSAATAGAAVTVTITSSNLQSGGPVATAITGGATGTASTDRAFGIIQNAPLYKVSAAGSVVAFGEAEITVSGISKVQAGGTINAGAAITADGVGNAMTLGTFGNTTATGGATQYVLGTALTGGAAGDIITVAISCANAVRGA